MTLRDAAAEAITLMGLYFAGRVIALHAALMVTPFILSPQAFSSSDPALAASLASGVGNLVTALIGLLGLWITADATVTILATRLAVR